jgi:hypothetical protein
MQTTISTLARGVAAGLAGTLVQTAVGKAEDLAFLPPSENSDISPRLVHRLGRDVGVDLSAPAKWTLGTAFHLGYGATWGAGYAAVRERYPVHPLVGGALLAGIIYGITFPNYGTAVQTQTERPVGVRTRRMEVVLASICLSFGLTTALAYERLRKRS